MHRFAPQILTVVILLLLVLPALRGPAPEAEALRENPSRPELATAAGSDELFLVFSINNVGYIDVCGCKRKKVRQGSLTRRAAYIHQARYHHDNLVLLDGGNTLFGPDAGKKKDFEKQQLIDKAKVIIESYNRMGYQAMVVGHHDITLGLTQLREFEALATFPLLSANLVYADDRSPVFGATTIIDAGELKIGVLAITIDTIPTYYLERANPERPLALENALETARKWVPQLREQCDIVVLLSANPADVNSAIATEVAGIDIIVDPFIELGNHKLWVDDADSVKTVGETILVRTDAQGARLGTLDINWLAEGRPMVSLSYDSTPPEGRSTYWYERVSIEPHLLEDPEIVLLMDAFKRGAGFVPPGKLPELSQKDNYLTATTCSVCHVEQTEFWSKTKHAIAFASLEANNDQWRQDCIACHVLGYGQAFIDPADAEPYKNVQCENCHGLNPNHPRDPVKHPWPAVQEISCLVCHNKNQTRIDFVFVRERPKVACPLMPRN